MKRILGSITLITIFVLMIPSTCLASESKRSELEKNTNIISNNIFKEFKTDFDGEKNIAIWDFDNILISSNETEISTGSEADDNNKDFYVTYKIDLTRYTSDDWVHLYMESELEDTTEWVYDNKYGIKIEDAWGNVLFEENRVGKDDLWVIDLEVQPDTYYITYYSKIDGTWLTGNNGNDVRFKNNYMTIYETVEPTIERIYFAEEDKNRVLEAGDYLGVYVEFSEPVIAEWDCTLPMSTGRDAGVINLEGNTVIFRYGVESSDSGYLTSYDAPWGTIKDRCGNEAILKGILGSYNETHEAGILIGSSALVPNDVPWEEASSWALADLKEAHGIGLYTNRIMNNFTNNITREEFCELTIKLYEKMTGSIATSAPTSTFSDTDNLDILKAYNLGIVNGVGNGKFAPERLVTREQMAVMFCNTMWAATNQTLYYNEDVTFSDKKNISSWAEGSVAYCSENKILEGSNNKFSPQGYATREQAIVVVLRVLRFLNT